jgi:hypothetical protein
MEPNKKTTSNDKRKKEESDILDGLEKELEKKHRLVRVKRLKKSTNVIKGEPVSEPSGGCARRTYGAWGMWRLSTKDKTQILDLFRSYITLNLDLVSIGEGDLWHATKKDDLFKSGDNIPRGPAFFSPSKETAHAYVREGGVIGHYKICKPIKLCVLSDIGNCSKKGIVKRAWEVLDMDNIAKSCASLPRLRELDEHDSEGVFAHLVGECGFGLVAGWMATATTIGLDNSPVKEIMLVKPMNYITFIGKHVVGRHEDPDEGIALTREFSYETIVEFWD